MEWSLSTDNSIWHMLCHYIWHSILFWNPHSMDNSFCVGLNCYGSYGPWRSQEGVLHLPLLVKLMQPKRGLFLHLHILKNGIMNLWRPRQRVSRLVGPQIEAAFQPGPVRLDVVCKQALQEVLSLNEAGSILLEPIYQLVCTTCVSNWGITYLSLY